MGEGLHCFRVVVHSVVMSAESDCDVGGAVMATAKRHSVVSYEISGAVVGGWINMDTHSLAFFKYSKLSCSRP